MVTSSVDVCTYPISNYRFASKEPKMEKDTSVVDQLARMKVKYMKEGMQRSVEGILLVHERNHLHVVLLQMGKTCKLPGGRLRPGENEIEGLKRKLHSELGATSPSSSHPNWQIGECVGTWWRPNFEGYLYPYCPPHITKPKERKKVFLVLLPERESLAVPKNLKLFAVPLFELYSNPEIYGRVLSTIPLHLSRFKFKMVRS